MVRSWDVPVANVYSGSDPDRYVPPSTTSFCCTGTGPPRTRILEPAAGRVGARRVAVPPRAAAPNTSAADPGEAVNVGREAGRQGEGQARGGHAHRADQLDPPYA